MADRVNSIRQWHRKGLAQSTDPSSAPPSLGAVQRLLAGLEGCGELGQHLAETGDLAIAIQRWDPSATEHDAAEFAAQLANTTHLQSAIRRSQQLARYKRKQWTPEDILQCQFTFLMSVIDDPHEATKDRIKASEVVAKLTGGAPVVHKIQRDEALQEPTSPTDFIERIRKELLGVDAG